MITLHYDYINFQIGGMYKKKRKLYQYITRVIIGLKHQNEQFFSYIKAMKQEEIKAPIIYIFRWRSSYIEGIVGILLTFVYICFVAGQRKNIYKQRLMGSQPSLLYNWNSHDKTYINKR
jgi:hypothetical protein